VVPKEKDTLVPLYSTANRTGAVEAQLQSGVLASVKQCTGTWCHIAGSQFDGWIEQNRIWGAYPNEKVD
jgi:SH3-like domain-containing protein